MVRRQPSQVTSAAIFVTLPRSDTQVGPLLSLSPDSAAWIYIRRDCYQEPPPSFSSLVLFLFSKRREVILTLNREETQS